MKPIIVDGLLRPDLDLRWTPISLMATYLDISRTTLWHRLVAGQVPPNCTRAFGTRTHWCPAAYFAETRRLTGPLPQHLTAMETKA